MEKQKSKGKGVLKRLAVFLKPHYGWLVGAVIFSIIVSITNIAVSYMLKEFVDATIGHDVNSIYVYGMLLALLFLISLPSNMLRTLGSGRFAEYGLYDIRQKTGEYINTLDAAFLENHPSGDLISRVNNDINLLSGFLQGNLGQLLYTPILFLMALTFLVMTSWKLSIFSLTVIPLLLFCTMKVSKPIQKFTKEQQEALSKVNSTAQDSISGLIVTKSFNLEGVMNQKFERGVDVSVSKALKLSKIQSLIEPIGFLMQMLPFILTFGFGGYLVINGDMTFGGLLSFINVLNFVVNPIMEFPGIISGIRSADAAASRIFEIWDAPQEKSGEEVPEKGCMDVISFNDVCFSYAPGSPVLQELNLKIKKGETVALVGYSGCGKSTIIKLITSFYEPQDGSISICGLDTRRWKLDELRKMFSVVSQDTYLFPESIYANIAYGREGASMDEVVEAAKAADIHDTIVGFPDGYETVAGERGVKLSGGQKQRIAVARALLKDAPILLLDEATSSLDVESEKEVQLAVERLMKNRTVLVIAHRLSTIINADRILVIDNGRVIESGKHQDLIDNSKLYRQLYFGQFNQEDVSDIKVEQAGR